MTKVTGLFKDQFWTQQLLFFSVTSVPTARLIMIYYSLKKLSFQPNTAKTMYEQCIFGLVLQCFVSYDVIYKINIQ